MAMVELTWTIFIEIDNKIVLKSIVELTWNSSFFISIENLKQLQEESINHIAIWTSNLVKLKSFQCHEWVHFNFISTCFIFCVFLFLRYASSVILWMDHESLITFKLAFPSLCLASILCCWCLLIPPCKSSCSSCYINALTSTSIPSNIMLYNKQ
jgi:hypothetical protein